MEDSHGSHPELRGNGGIDPGVRGSHTDPEACDSDGVAGETDAAGAESPGSGGEPDEDEGWHPV